eukprot:3756700-Rhodomonas_salina.4
MLQATVRYRIALCIRRVGFRHHSTFKADISLQIAQAAYQLTPHSSEFERREAISCQRSAIRHISTVIERVYTGDRIAGRVSYAGTAIWYYKRHVSTNPVLKQCLGSV